MEMRINPDFPKRPDRNKVDALKEIGAATISAELKHIAGIKDSFMMGPKSCALGKTIGGPAITLQFMPIREDYYQDAEEYQNVEEQLHRHALYLAQAGDVVVVDARGDLSSGVFGEMMLAYFHGVKNIIDSGMGFPMYQVSPVISFKLIILQMKPGVL